MSEGADAHRWDGPAGAVAFLTIIPARGGAELSSAAAWFPLVGGLVGAAAGAVRLGGGHVFGPAAGTVLAMIVLVALTGALHQDGLADSLDGLGVRGDRSRRLAVMRDSSTGAFGVLGLIGWALLLYAALEPLTGDHAFRTLIAAGAASRLTILLQAIGADPARRDGLGAALSVSVPALLLASAFTVAIALVAVEPLHGLLVLGVTAACALLLTLFAARAYGGRTGDTLGATVAITEVAVCLTMVACWHH
ncbi:MAG TPA: adenosylcobinamide-GDP ribazoletransferase [Solirubrobacteraceae bacterium]|nr:adenosylcobinamide-GDP ribazoletransferase [Solirubrobacteraceae bacterium]